MEKAKRPRVNLGGHTNDSGPVMSVGIHAYEFDEYTALSWVNTLNAFLWQKMTINAPIPLKHDLHGDE